MNNVTFCQKGTCVSVKGNLASFVALAIGFAIIAYGVSVVAKTLR